MVTLPLNADADLALEALFALTMVFFDTVHIISAVYCTKVVIFRNTPISFYDNPMSKNCGSSYESGEDESYFRKNFPCNARRKISGVGLFFREKSFSLRKSSRKNLRFRRLNDFQLTCGPRIRGINFPKHPLRYGNSAVLGSVFHTVPTRDRSLQRESVA